jgi:simple sugar transport system ATP-binding protein
MNTVSLRNIAKVFHPSGIRALESASMDLASGEIHALVGENGAGKTTLMKILAGQESPDSGEIVKDPKNRIGMVHQHFMTIPGFTVAENILFGDEPTLAGCILDRRAMLAQAVDSIQQYGFRLDPGRLAETLSVGERQQVEILRQLHRRSDILILDEPTSVLAEQEIESLFTMLASLKKMGRTIVMVTHKVREVLSISDSVTVLRKGRTLGTFPTASMTKNELSDLMIGASSGRASALQSSTPKPGGNSAKTVLEFRNLSIRRRHHGRALLDGVNLRIGAGEIHGICGIAGNGLSEMENLLAGILRPGRGQILLAGRPYPRLRRAPWLKGGIAYVPSDRMKRGSCGERSIMENFVALDRDTFFPHGIMDWKSASSMVRSSLAGFDLEQSPDASVSELSGGSIQKMILSRELSGSHPELCVLCEPTWGLDSSSMTLAYSKIRELKGAGSAIVLISSNLDEILELSDNITVFHKGKTAATLTNGPQVSREALGALMLGLGPNRGAGSAGEPR